MKKAIFSLAFLFVATISLSSCKEETKLDTLEDQLEERSDDLEDAADDIGDAAVNIEEALEDLQDALEEIDNPADREEVRKRVNEIFDRMQVEMNSGL